MSTSIQDVESKLEEIANFLLQYDYKQLNAIGLLSGNSGIMLFLFHYGRYTQDEKYLDQAVSLLYQSMNLINDNQADYYFSTGISGFGWTLEHLAENNFIDPVEVLHALDEHFCKLMLEESQDGYWDALHGGIGIAQYLFYRLDNETVFKSMETMVEILDQQAISDQEGIKWLSHNRTKGESAFNFGLAHGTPSIIVFLKKCIDHNIKVNLAKSLLHQAVQYLLSKKSDPKESPNLYPILILEGNTIHSKRLAWCYGDPGILISFLHANKILKSLDKEIEELAKSIVGRKDLVGNNLMDACLCHGTAGMIPMLEIIRREQELEQYVPGSILEYWVGQTLNLANKADGLAGYKQFIIVEHQPAWINEIGLLEGLTGTAFSLLSYLDKDLSWSRCLMMS